MAFRMLPLPQGVEGRLFLSPLLGLLTNYQADVQEIHKKEITTVIRLIPDHDVAIKSPEYFNAIKSHLIPWQDINFSRYACPTPDVCDKFFILSDRVARILKGGKNCLIHCLMGKVRTGTLAAAVLIKLGTPLEEAIKIVGEAGSTANTKEQISFLEFYASQKGERNFFFRETSSI